MKEKVFIKNRDGLKIAINVITSPINKKLVILEHGLSARKEYPHMLVMEEIFAKHGFNVVNFDATNSLNESDIAPSDITFSGHYNDLVDVINWTKTQKFYVEPFALAGQSLGAASCLKYAGTYPNDVNLLVVASCPFVVGENLVKNDMMMIEVEKNGFYDKVSKSVNRTLRINKIFNDDIKTINLEPQIKNIKAKTFVIQGLLDSEYIIETSKQIYDLLNTEKQLIYLKNTPHDLANTPETKKVFVETMENILKK